MPDFFTRLAERTLGLADTIQPIVPSLFAPGAPLIDAELAAEPAIEERATQPDRAVPPEIDAPAERQRPDQTRQAEPIPPRPVVRQPNAQPAPTVERVRPAQPQNNPGPGSEPTRTTPHAEAPHQIAPSAVPPTSPISPAAGRSQPASQIMRRVESTQIVSRAEPAPSSESRSPRPSIDPPPTSITPSRSHSLVSEQPVDRELPGTSTPLVPVADERQPQSVERREIATPVERPELVAREPSLPRHQFTPRTPEPPAAQPAPQIHVSIGRIEVRAVTPPPAAAPQPKPTPTPRMSLDDYLRSQNGDRR